MAVDWFKQALHFTVPVAQEQNIVNMGVRYVGVRTNLNPWVALQCMPKNPKDSESHPLAPTFVFVSA